MSVIQKLKADYELNFDSKIDALLYSITNEVENKVEIFARFDNGMVKSLKKVKTNGVGSTNYSTFKGMESSDPQLSSHGIIISPDHEWLFCVNGGENSVSSFKIKSDGDLRFVDKIATSNSVKNTINSLAFNPVHGVLYVNHVFGEHVHIFRVAEGTLKSIFEPATINMKEGDNRASASITISPNNKFLISNILIDNDPKEGDPVPAVENNLAVHILDDHGMITETQFKTVPGPSFSCDFIDESIIMISYALTNQFGLLKMDEHGDITALGSIPIQAKDGKMPSETCWQVYNKEDSIAYASNFGYGSVTSAKIDDDTITLLEDEAAFEVSHNGEVAIAGYETSAAQDAVYYNGMYTQIYGSIGKLITYKTKADGTLDKVSEVATIRQSQFGLALLVHNK